MLPIVTLAKSHITRPVGAAIATALPSTNKVLSNNERTKIFPICGFLYGGSSKIKDDGTPLSTVLERSFETTRVSQIPSNINNRTDTVDTIDENEVAKKLPMKIVAIVIKKGNLPIAWYKIICKYCN